MANEEDKRIDVKESPKGEFNSTDQPAKEDGKIVAGSSSDTTPKSHSADGKPPPHNIESSPAKSELMEEIKVLRSHVKDL